MRDTAQRRESDYQGFSLVAVTLAIVAAMGAFIGVAMAIALHVLVALAAWGVAAVGALLARWAWHFGVSRREATSR